MIAHLFSSTGSHSIADTDEDRALLQRVALQDADALAAFYERHASQVCFRLNLILNDHATAEDLVHEVFLTVWKQAAEFDSRRGSPAAWLTVIARNRARDYQRWKKPRTAPKELHEERAEPADSSASLEQEIIE